MLSVIQERVIFCLHDHTEEVVTGFKVVDPLFAGSAAGKMIRKLEVNRHFPIVQGWCSYDRENPPKGAFCGFPRNNIDSVL